MSVKLSKPSSGGGEARAALRAVNWSETSLGPVRNWSQSLRTVVGTILASRFPMCIYWGPEYIQIYNDAFLSRFYDKQAAGISARITWAEIWAYVGPTVAHIVKTGQAESRIDQRFEPTRRGFLEEAYFTFCYSPLVDDDGSIAGILDTSIETTERVLAERRLASMQSLAAASTSARTTSQACERAADALRENAHDVPFALFYLMDKLGKRATLAAAQGFEAGMQAAPHTINLQVGNPAWPLNRVIEDNTPLLVEDLKTRFRGFHAGPWPEAPSSVLILPLYALTGEAPIGLLILGISPRLVFDTAYRDFFELVARQTSANIAEATARQKERERLERLAELDQIKIEFFSNVSHEFRTPLTLMLAPLEELLRQRKSLPNGLGEEVEVASRNGRRLLMLVNALLDFSQAEAGRLHAFFEPTDLAQLTDDIASLFRSAAERAGLHLRIDCLSLQQPVWVDRQMCEKIVSNLLANALKFTFEGEIVVEMHALPQHAELVVRDTGVGIPEAEIPNLFKRFHRVQGTRARTLEGSGIGLALVHELVRLHNGRIRVKSRPGEGSTFTVWIPLGARPAREVKQSDEMSGTRSAVASSLAEVAAQWTSADDMSVVESTEIVDDPLGKPFSGSSLVARSTGARVLVVDDNSDMRDYLQRLLTPYWQVEAANDGIQALEQARRHPPDLILADVLMPNLDGFGLLRGIRADETLKTTPVVVLTAGASEDAAIEGLLAGADDYIAKPFSTRELVARVSAQLELAQVRRESEAQFRSLVTATSDAIFKMSPDWDEMRYLDGKDFIRSTVNPSRSWLETYIPSEDIPAVLKVIREAIQHKRVFELEHRVIRVDGTPGWAFSRAIPLLDEHGKITEWLGAASNTTNRKRAEEALRGSEAKFRTLSDAAPALIWQNNSQGENLFVNQHFLDFVGMSAKQIRGEGWHTLVHPDDREAYVADYLAAVREHSAWNSQNRIRRHDGEWRWFDNHAQPLFGDGGVYVGHVGASVDITEKKRAEELLRENQEHQAFLLKVSDAVRPLADPVEIMVIVSEMVGRQLEAGRCGYAEVPPPYDQLVVTRDWADGVMQSLQGTWPLASFGETVIAAYRSGQTVVFEDVFDDDRVRGYETGAIADSSVRSSIAVQLMKGGEWVATFYVQDTVARHWTQHQIKLVEEIAERTWSALERARAEEAMAKSEQRLRLLFETMSQGVAIMELVRNNAGDVVDARYLELNSAFETLTGLDRDAAAGRLASEVFSQHFLTWRLRLGTVEGTAGSERFESYIPDIRRWFSFYAAPFGGSDGFVMFYDDITERKRIEEYHAYMLKLSDAIRSLSDAEEIKTSASRILGKHLGVNRAFYAEVDGDEWLIGKAYEQDIEPQAEGRHPMAQFGQWIIDLFYAGEQLVIRDLYSDTRFEPSQRAAHDAYHILGAIAVPLVKKGVLVAILVIHSATPRDWNDHEIALVEETAERTWAAVERARAEDALRRSEEYFRTLVDVAAQTTWTTNTDGRVVVGSPSWSTSTGQPLEEQLGLGWLNAVHPDDRNAVHMQWQNTVRTQTSMSAVLRLRHAGGGWRRTWLRAKPILNTDGSVKGWLGVNLDVAEFESAQAASRAAHADGGSISNS